MHAFEEDRLLFTFAFSFLGAETILGGLSLYLVERGGNAEITNVGDGLWWALVTITTVGFGDITPVTTLGRVIGGVMMVGGLFTLALFAGIVGHSLLHAVLSIREEQFRMSGYVNHIVVCGYEMGSGMLLQVLASEIDFDEQKGKCSLSHGLSEVRKRGARDFRGINRADAGAESTGRRWLRARRA